jgi:chromosomal replication initiation ATPase DnaA
MSASNTEYFLNNDLQSSYFNFLRATPLLVPSAYIQEIDSWVTKNLENSYKNHPLVISGTTGCGKSSLVTKWIEYYIQSHGHTQTVLLYHCVSLSRANDQLYATLYHICYSIKVKFI